MPTISFIIHNNKPVGWPPLFADELEQVVAKILGHDKIVQQSLFHRVLVKAAVKRIQRTVILLRLTLEKDKDEMNAGTASAQALLPLEMHMSRWARECFTSISSSRYLFFYLSFLFFSCFSRCCYCCCCSADLEVAVVVLELDLDGVPVVVLADFEFFVAEPLL